MKRLLNQCADNSKAESDISAEEIKQAVMAKIKGNAPTTEVENGEFVQPTFANTRPKRKYALTAAAAAVCVGVGAAGIAVANGGVGDIDFSALTETTENTEETAEEFVGVEENENVVTFTLLDGEILHYNTVTYIIGGESPGKESDMKLEVRDDELWFFTGGESINITEAAGDKDYYIYKYINSGTGKEHQVIIANTTNPFYCGYMEVYQLDGRDGYEGAGCNSHIHSEVINTTHTPDISYSPEQYWLTAALDDMGLIREYSEEAINFLWWRASGGAVLTDERVELADGTSFQWNDAERCWQEKKVGTETDNVIKAEDGKVYYTAFRENTDITGKTDSDTPYVRQYYVFPLYDSETGADSSCMHFIVAGGTQEGGDLGYAELFFSKDKWYGSTYNAVVGDELRPWLKTALDALFDDLNADNFFEKCTMSSDRAVIEQLAQMVYMLDGSWENGSQQSMPQWDIFETRDGKLWFTGNGERIDVAEAAGDKDYFIYRYTPEGSIDERIVIGENTAEVDDVEEVGYLEIYSVYDAEHGVYTHYRGLGNNVYLWKENIEDGVEDIKPWVKNAFEELGLRLADNNVIAVNEVVIGRG